MQALARLDRALSRPVQQLELGWLEHLLVLPGGRLFGGSGLIKYTAPALVGLHLLWRPMAWSVVHGLLLLYLIIYPAKALVGRPRPLPGLGGKRLLPVRQRVDHELMSFPSGDASQAAVIMGTVYVWADGPGRCLLLLPVLLCMLGRVYFVCHWVLDTVVGAALGLGAVWVTEQMIGCARVAPVDLVMPLGLLAAEAVVLKVLGKLGWIHLITTTGNDMKH